MKNQWLKNKKPTASEVWDKWKKLESIGRGDFFESPYLSKMQVALALENQRLHNEKLPDTGTNSQFKRLSIPIMLRLMKQCEQITEVATVKSRMISINCGVSFSEAIKDLRCVNNLDAEAELTAILWNRLKYEIEQLESDIKIGHLSLSVIPQSFCPRTMLNLSYDLANSELDMFLDEMAALHEKGVTDFKSLYDKYPSVRIGARRALMVAEQRCK